MISLDFASISSAFPSRLWPSNQKKLIEWIHENFVLHIRELVLRLQSSRKIESLDISSRTFIIPEEAWDYNEERVNGFVMAKYPQHDENRMVQHSLLEPLRALTVSRAVRIWADGADKGWLEELKAEILQTK